MSTTEIIAEARRAIEETKDMDFPLFAAAQLLRQRTNWELTDEEIESAIDVA